MTTPPQTTVPRFTLYSTAWCHHCLEAKDWLKKHGLEPGRDYDDINIEESAEAADTVEKLNDGFRTVPTFRLADGTVFSEPTPAELAEHFPMLSSAEPSPI